MSQAAIDPKDKIIVVTGITGKQGGATAQALLDKGFKVRGITRNVDSSRAKSWVEKGVELTTADLNDQASLEKAFEGAYGVFLITDHGENGAVEVSCIICLSAGPSYYFLTDDIFVFRKRSRKEMPLPMLL